MFFSLILSPVLFWKAVVNDVMSLFNPNPVQMFQNVTHFETSSHGCLDTLGKVVFPLKWYFIILFEFFYIANFIK